METKVTTQKLVTITATMDEWVNKLADPEAFLVEIENAILDTEQMVPAPHPNGRKSPKGRTARGSGTGRASSLICQVCGKSYKHPARFQQHMDRMHTSTVESAAG